MPIKRKKSKHPTLLENAHDIAKGLYEVGIMDATTMRKFDVMCFPEVKELSSAQIKKIRLREKVSQPVFAKCLNISPATVKQWERGERRPQGLALKVLNLIAEQGLGVMGYKHNIAV